MRILPAAGLVLALAGPCLHPSERAPGPIFEAAGQDPYYRGKHGFRDVIHAKNHAYREFQREVRAGRIDPSRDEFFTFIYTLEPEDGRPLLFFHAPWAKARFLKRSNGCLQHQVQSPLAEGAGIRIFTLMHSHPTQLPGGLGPSRADVATASKYKNLDGSFRYLYLVNSRGQLVQFKARRDLSPQDAAALSRLPIQPRRAVDWLD